MSNQNTTYVGRQISYRFNNGVPNQLSQRVGTNETSNSLLYNGCLHPGSVDAQAADAPGGRAVSRRPPAGPRPERTASSPTTSSVARSCFHAPTACRATTTSRRGWVPPTTCLATGKTALKVNVGQYLQGAYTGDVYTINNPGSTLVTSINRSWSDPNGNRVGRMRLHESGGQRRVRCVVGHQLGLFQRRPRPSILMCSRAGARAIAIGSSASACSRRSRRRSRSRSATTGGCGATSSSRITARSRPRTTTRSR